MMKDVISKNGVLLNGVRTWDELTSNEQATVNFPAGESKADYKNYQVRHDGKGELLDVQVYEFSDKKSEEIKSANNQWNMIDAMNTVFGSGKQKSAALKKYSRVNGHKLNVSTKELRNALETR